MSLWITNKLLNKFAPEAFRPCENVSERCISGVAKFFYDSTLLSVDCLLVGIGILRAARVAAKRDHPSASAAYMMGGMYLAAQASMLLTSFVTPLALARVGYSWYRGRMVIMRV